jgi:hypothetical protein
MMDGMDGMDGIGSLPVRSGVGAGLVALFIPVPPVRTVPHARALLCMWWLCGRIVQ